MLQSLQQGGGALPDSWMFLLVVVFAVNGENADLNSCSLRTETKLSEQELQLLVCCHKGSGLATLEKESREFWFSLSS